MIRVTDCLTVSACFRNRASISFPTRRRPFRKFARMAGSEVVRQCSVSPAVCLTRRTRRLRPRIAVSSPGASRVTVRSLSPEAMKPPSTGFAFPWMRKTKSGPAPLPELAQRGPAALPARRDDEAEHEQHDQQAVEHAAERPLSNRVGGFLPASRPPRRISRAPSHSGIA